MGIVSDPILQTVSDCFTSKRQLSAQEPSFNLLENIFMTGRKRPEAAIGGYGSSYPFSAYQEYLDDIQKRDTWAVKTL